MYSWVRRESYAIRAIRFCFGWHCKGQSSEGGQGVMIRDDITAASHRQAGFETVRWVVAELSGFTETIRAEIKTVNTRLIWKINKSGKLTHTHFTDNCILDCKYVHNVIDVLKYIFDLLHHLLIYISVQLHWKRILSCCTTVWQDLSFSGESPIKSAVLWDIFFLNFTKFHGKTAIIVCNV